MIPTMLRRYRAAGVDPLREPILTYPVLHYQNGGLRIDADGRRRWTASSPPARSRAACTGATG